MFSLRILWRTWSTARISCWTAPRNFPLGPMCARSMRSAGTSGWRNFRWMTSGDITAWFPMCPWLINSPQQLGWFLYIYIYHIYIYISYMYIYIYNNIYIYISILLVQMTHVVLIWFYMWKCHMWSFLCSWSPLLHGTAESIMTWKNY